jgi:hypothetical protein
MKEQTANKTECLRRYVHFCGYNIKNQYIRVTKIFKQFFYCATAPSGPGPPQSQDF